MLGSVFWKAGKKRSRLVSYKQLNILQQLRLILINKMLLSLYRDSSADLNMIIGALYSAVFFVGVNNCQTVQPVVAVERTVFYREKAAGMYSALPYAIAQVREGLHIENYNQNSVHVAYSLILT